MTSDLGVFIPGGKIGILLLHNVGAAAAELRPLANAMSRAGYSVACPQLGTSQPPSHQNGSGTVGPDGPGLWLSEAEHALARLKARTEGIIVLGCGYGAMLGLELARRNTNAVHALVLIEPRAWLPAISGTLSTTLASLVPQVWLARVMTTIRRIYKVSDGRYGSAPTAFLSTGVASESSADRAAHHRLGEVALLLDSVHGGLPSITQPVLLVQRPAMKQGGLDSCILLQRHLGGRVESASVDDAGHNDRLLDEITERSARFVSAVFEELETKRGNELRRQRTAGRSNAA